MHNCACYSCEMLGLFTTPTAAMGVVVVVGVVVLGEGGGGGLCLFLWLSPPPGGCLSVSVDLLVRFPEWMASLVSP